MITDTRMCENLNVSSVYFARFCLQFHLHCLNFLEYHLKYTETLSHIYRDTHTPALWHHYYLHTLCRKGTTRKSCFAHHFFLYTKMPWSVCFFFVVPFIVIYSAYKKRRRQKAQYATTETSQ